jgi:hypothetical protein
MRKPIRRRKANLDGMNLHMNVPSIGNQWVTRWVNDQKNRCYQLNTMDDWEYVTPDEIPDPHNPGKPLVGQAVKNPDVEGGGRVSMKVGVDKDGPIIAYLMKKRKEFVEDDLAEKHKRLDEQHRQLTRGITPVDHQRGTVQID